MDERNNDFNFDFTPIGQAIKKNREARGMTREQLSGIIGYAPRHIQSIENEGKYPSIKLFIQLITMFDVSVDEYIFPNPVMDFKYDILKHPNVRLTADGGQPPYIHGEPTQAVATFVFDSTVPKDAVMLPAVSTSYELLSEEDLEE